MLWGTPHLYGSTYRKQYHAFQEARPYRGLERCTALSPFDAGLEMKPRYRAPLSGFVRWIQKAKKHIIHVLDPCIRFGQRTAQLTVLPLDSHRLFPHPSLSYTCQTPSAPPPADSSTLLAPRLPRFCCAPVPASFDLQRSSLSFWRRSYRTWRPRSSACLLSMLFSLRVDTSFIVASGAAFACACASRASRTGESSDEIWCGSETRWSYSMGYSVSTGPT